MNRKSTALIGCLLLLTACAITGKAVLPPVEQGPPIQMYFCPADDCNSVLVSQLSNARDIVCALYSLDAPEIKQILKEKNAQIMAETDNQNDFSELHATFDRTSALMHNKFCVLDNSTVITGSYNPTIRNKKANDIIIIPSTYLAQNYLAEFKELQQGTFGRGRQTLHPVIIYNNATIQTSFCPEDDCAGKLLETLKKARQRIRFMTYSFTDDQIGEFLASTSVEVEGIFDPSQNRKFSEYNKLANKSVLRGIHHKVFIIDNETVITGSYNPTKNGNERNDENMLIINDERIAAEYIQQFSRVIFSSSIANAPSHEKM